jgi:nucleotide-binding universal stress UspA family protein
VDGSLSKIRRVICAVDRNPRARLVLRWVRDFRRAVGAHLTVVHVISPCYRESDSRWSEEFRRDAKAALYRRLDELQMTASVHVERGEVSPVVRSVIENTSADLLVIGKSFDRHGRGSLVSNAYSLIRQSNCPVISV